MDKEEIEKRERQLKEMLSVGISEEHAKLIFNLYDTDPKIRSDAQQLRLDRVASMLEQQYECSFAVIDVKREKETVTIVWTLKAAAGDPLNCSVHGKLFDIDLIPDPEHLRGTFLVSARGNGKVTVKLYEGLSYHFFFGFMTNPDSQDKWKLDGNTFNVAIPLSPEKAEIIKRTTKWELNPEEGLRDTLTSFSKMRDVFDEITEQEVAKIKSKNLPPEEEQRRTEDFKDFAERVREKFEI